MIGLISRAAGRIGRRALLASAVVAVLNAIPASAAPILVGSGDESANVVLNFSDGATYEFVVAYPGPSTTGEQLIRTIDTALPTFTLGSSGTGAGFFITDITYDGHTDGPAFIPPEGWWHYWTKGGTETSWTSAQIGAGARTIDNGYTDGWVFGNAAAPIPEPATAGLIGAAMVGLLARRRVTRA